jgi:hypothetical protein
MFFGGSMFFILSILIAHATELEQWAQGNFYCQSTVKEVENERQKAMEETLKASNIIIRTLAEPKLQGLPHICKGYQIKTVENIMHITCDDLPTIAIMLDGTPTQYPNDDGSGFNVIADVQNTKIVQDFQGENGGIVVTYQFSEGKLFVTKTINSGYLGKALTVSFGYEKRE